MYGRGGVRFYGLSASSGAMLVMLNLNDGLAPSMERDIIYLWISVRRDTSKVCGHVTLNQKMSEGGGAFCPFKTSARVPTVGSTYPNPNLFLLSRNEFSAQVSDKLHIAEKG